MNAMRAWLVDKPTAKVEERGHALVCSRCGAQVSAAMIEREIPGRPFGRGSTRRRWIHYRCPNGHITQELPLPDAS